jgi:hypothetical protein
MPKPLASRASGKDDKKARESRDAISSADIRSELEAARQRVKSLVKEALDADRQPSKALNLRLK